MHGVSICGTVRFFREQIPSKELSHCLLMSVRVVFEEKKILVAVVDLCCVINVDFLVWVVKKAVAVKRTGEEYLERVVDLNLVMELVTDV